MSDFPKVEIDSNNEVKIYFDANSPDVCGIHQTIDPTTGEAFPTKKAAQAWVDAFFEPVVEVEVVQEETPAIEA